MSAETAGPEPSRSPERPVSPMNMTFETKRSSADSCVFRAAAYSGRNAARGAGVDAATLPLGGRGHNHARGDASIWEGAATTTARHRAFVGNSASVTTIAPSWPYENAYTGTRPIASDSAPNTAAAI